MSVIDKPKDPDAKLAPELNGVGMMMTAGSQTKLCENDQLPVTLLGYRPSNEMGAYTCEFQL